MAVFITDHTLCNRSHLRSEYNRCISNDDMLRVAMMLGPTLFWKKE